MQDENQQVSKSQQIVGLLKQSSDSGLNFEAAKEKLRTQGFSDIDINQATDNYQYGEKQVSDIPTNVTQYFNQHPDEALNDGAGLLKAVKQDEVSQARTKAMLDFGAERAAGEFGPMGIDAKAEFAGRFANDIGIPFWVFILIGAGVTGSSVLVIIWLHASALSYIITGIISIVEVTLLIRRIS